MTTASSIPNNPQREARIAELLRCRQQIDTELAELGGAVLPAGDRFDRQLLERLTAMAPIGIAVVHGPEHRFSYVNPAYQVIPGTMTTPMIGRTLAEVFPDLIAKGVIAGLDQIYATGQPVAFRTFEASVGPGREQTYWDVDEVPILDGQGQVESILILTREVTDQVWAEEALQESHRWTEEILASIQDGFLTINQDWVITYINQRAAGNGGFSPAELIGNNLWELFPYFLGRPIEAHYRQAMAERCPLTFELTSSLAPVWYEVRVYPTSDGISVYWIDITERKQAEEALQESERRYSALFANKINGMAHCRIITDEHGQPVDYVILQINEAYERIIGIKKADIEGRRVTDVFPDITQYAFDYIGVYGKIALEGGEIKFEEYFEATQQYLSIYAYSPLPGEFAALFTDVTKRKYAEEALRESEERYHRLFDSMTEGFLLAELIRDDAGTPIDFRILEANLAYESILGCPREAAIGKTLFEVFPGLDRDRFAAIAHVAQTGEPLRWQGVFAPTGRCYENVYYSPRPGQLAGIFTDITARMQAEEALQQSQQQFAALIQNVESGVVLIDAHEQFTVVNPKFLRLFGLAEAPDNIMNVNSQDWSAWQLFDEDSVLLDVDAHPVRKAALTGRTVRNRLVGMRLPAGGDLVWMLVSAEPILNADGGVDQLICTYHDITDRKRAEEALIASLHEKEVLLKEIHHRVKNNMQVISSLVSLQSDTIDDPALRALFNDLRDQVRTMALVHEKLYQSESLASVDFAEYTQSLLSYLWRAHGDAATAVRLHLDVEPVAISIEQAVPCGLMLNELVTNALKHAFRDRAGGEITVALQVDPDGTVCLSVRDNGVGLPADWRQSPSLGLQLVQMLTRQVCGTLDVRTDGGTAFALTFSQPIPSPHGEDRHV